MIIMHIGIVGGGPCGTYIAYQLSKAGHKVTLYEREEDIGGCWGVQRTQTGAFTEHAPRVMFDNYLNTKEFFKEIGVDFDENFKKVYTVFRKSLKDAKYYTLWDITALTIAYLYPSIAWNSHTVKSVMDTYNVSPSAREQITQLCYAIDGQPPEKLSAMEFFETIDTILPSTMYEPKIASTSKNGIVTKIKEALTDVDIKTSHTFKKHDPESNIATFSTPQGAFNTHHDKLIVCIPPEQLAKVYPSIHPRAQKMSYTGIGVQFHYDERTDPKDIPNPKTTTTGSLRIISSYNEQEHTISCVILNIDLPALTDTNKRQLINLTWKQLKEATQGLPKYTKATVTPTVYKKQDSTWTCRHGAYYRNKANDTISIHNIPGIAYVGSHNPRSFPFTSYESAIETAKYFLNESGLIPYKKHIKRPIRIKETLLKASLIAIGAIYITASFAGLRHSRKAFKKKNIAYK